MIKFEKFCDECKNRSWLRGADEDHPVATWMCGKDAKCWDDWKECNRENCYLLEEQNNDK